MPLTATSAATTTSNITAQSYRNTMHSAVGKRTDAWHRIRCQAPEPASLGRVALAAHDVERHIRLVAHHPAVVAGRHVEELAGAHHALGAVVHRRHRLAAQ